jgi:hypothetical protein
MFRYSSPNLAESENILKDSNILWLQFNWWPNQRSWSEEKTAQQANCVKYNNYTKTYPKIVVLNIPGRFSDATHTRQVLVVLNILGRFKLVVLNILGRF